jgi:S-formylglutathione hydrolase
VRVHEVAGHRVEVYQPAAPRPGRAIIYLHPLDGQMLWDRPAFVELFQSLGLTCVGPHGGGSWWTDRLCPRFDPALTAERWLMHHVVPWLSQHYRIPRGGLALLGLSMGGQAALRLAFKYPQQFPAVAALAPAIEYHQFYGRGTPLDAMYPSKEQCRQDTAPMHVDAGQFPPHIFFACDPDDETWYRGNDRLREKLLALGIPHTCDLQTRAGGHSWEYFDCLAEPALRFLERALQTWSYRLL